MEGGILSLVLWALSLAAGICSAALGAVLSYHWFAFGSNSAISVAALALYAAGSLVLVVALIALAASI